MLAVAQELRDLPDDDPVLLCGALVAARLRRMPRERRRRRVDFVTAP